nr:tetratricopeptide repeat protein [Streptomyces sp. NRRL S-118]
MGPDHPDTLNSRHNLGACLFRLDRHHEAAAVCAEALASRERVLGPDHPDTLNSRHNLATVLSSVGRHQEAADLHTATFTARERVLGPDHPDTLTSRNKSAEAWQQVQTARSRARGQRWRRLLRRR